MEIYIIKIYMLLLKDIIVWCVYICYYWDIGGLCDNFFYINIGECWIRCVKIWIWCVIVIIVGDEDIFVMRIGLFVCVFIWCVINFIVCCVMFDGWYWCMNVLLCVKRECVDVCFVLIFVVVLCGLKLIDWCFEFEWCCCCVY